MGDELYHRAILELAKQAGRTGRLGQPEVTVTVDNPLCGDRITLDLSMTAGRVRDIGHRVRGCLLCQAAAAAIAARAPGETAATLRQVAGGIERAIREDPAAADGLWPELAAFVPVHPHKSRHDCVLLPFDALLQALDRVVSG